jgi:hypothetical protein
MVYLAAILTNVGQSVFGVVGMRDWVITSEGDWDLPDTARVKDIFCNDVADLELASKLKPSATSTRARECTYAAWRHVASSYLICERDRVVTLGVQEEMSALPGARCDVETLDAGHMPFLSRPDFTASYIRRAAGERM